MADNNSKPPVAVFNLGDHVAIRLSGGATGRVSELRGPLGPGGIAIYRVRVGPKPFTYVEVRGDQLDAIPSPRKKSRTP